MKPEFIIHYPFAQETRLFNNIRSWHVKMFADKGL